MQKKNFSDIKCGKKYHLLSTVYISKTGSRCENFVKIIPDFYLTKFKY